MNRNKIVSVQPDGAWVNVHLEDGALIRVRGSIFNRIAPSPDEGDDAGAFQALLTQAEMPSALDAALKYLTARARSKREVETKLAAAGFHEEAIARTIERLSARGILDDSKFARDWIETRTRKAVGPSRARAELARKGISNESIEQAAQSADGSEYQRAADALMLKTINKYRDDNLRDIKRKSIQTLLRRGYSWEQALSAYKRASASASDPDSHEDF